MCIEYPIVGLVFAKHPVLHSVPFMYCRDVSSFGNTPVKMYVSSFGRGLWKCNGSHSGMYNAGLQCSNA